MNVDMDKHISVPSNEHSQLQLDVGSVLNKLRENIHHSEDTEQVNKRRSSVESRAPFESVKEEVNKYGGITDWTAHRILSTEKHKHVEHDLEIALEEIPQYKKKLEAAEDAKAQALKERNVTNRLIEELKLKLERAQSEEAQVKLDSELAHLRVSEMEQRIANEMTATAKVQLEVAKARHTAVVEELKSVKEEVEALQGKYVSLVNDQDMAIKRTQRAVSESTQIEKEVEELNAELLVAREALASAHSAHLEAEEQTIAAAMAREQDSLNWKKELKKAEEEVQKLNKQLSSAHDLKSKLDAASAMLLNLKTEFAACMESESTQDIESIDNEENPKGKLEQNVINPTKTQAAVTSARRELEEAKVDIEKAKDYVNCLRVAAKSLKLELEKEKAALFAMRQRGVVVASLKAKLNGTLSELKLVQVKEKEAKEMMMGLSRELEQATQETGQAKLEASQAHEALEKAKEEVEQAKASLSTTGSRLDAALKEIGEAKASERLALAAGNALQESEFTRSMEDKVQENELATNMEENGKPTGVTLPLEEYHSLSRRAHVVEEQSHLRVAASIYRVELAKESEAKSLADLEEANREMNVRKEELKMALERAEKAEEGKLSVEQELRTWRAENEQRRKAGDAASGIANSVQNSLRRDEDGKELKNFDRAHDSSAYSMQPVPSPSLLMPQNGAVASELKAKKKKKKSLFPRIGMFLGKKKSQSTK